MPVGLINDACFVENTIELKPGDRLLLYSDGITEARDPSGAFFGDEGLARFLKYKQNDPVAGFFDDLVNFLDSFVGGPELDDDISGILLSFKG